MVTGEGLKGQEDFQANRTASRKSLKLERVWCPCTSKKASGWLRTLGRQTPAVHQGRADNGEPALREPRCPHLQNGCHAPPPTGLLQEQERPAGARCASRPTEGPQHQPQAMPTVRSAGGGHRAKSNPQQQEGGSHTFYNSFHSAVLRV